MVLEFITGVELKITERAIASFITSLFLFIFLGGQCIGLLRRWGLGQKVSRWGPERHLSKEGTPTAGGLFIFLFSSLSSIIFGDITNTYLLISLLCYFLFTVLGFVDDVLKKKSPKRGFTVLQKFSLQILLSVFVLYLAEKTIGLKTGLRVPFSTLIITLSFFLYFVFSVFVITGSSNAVNLTDGLDGLAGGHLLIAFSVSLVFVYLAGHSVFADYLHIVFVPGVGEVTVLISAVLGALLGFLWYNSHPAEVFMGDSGSLSLGALLGFLSVLAKFELFLPILGGIFVVEALSVIIQVVYFKATGGKRIFRMSPIHHHFELGGMSETKIVARFMIVAVMLGGIALLGLKIK